MGRKKYKNLIGDTIAFSIGNFGSKLILFLLVPLYTNILTTSEYGISELIATIANLIIPIVSLVIHDAVLRFTLDSKVNKNNVLYNSIIVAIFGSICAIPLVFVISCYPSIKPWSLYLYFYVVSSMFSQILMTYLKAESKTKLFVLLGMVQTFLMAVYNIVLLVFLKKGVEGYLLANIVSHISVIVLILFTGNIFSDLRKAYFDKSLLYKMIIYSSPLILNNISWWIVQSSDKFMVEYLVGSAALGLYTIASKIPALINVVVNIFAQAWGISAIKEYDGEQDGKFYSNVYRIYMFLIMVFALLAISLIKYLMPLYVGSDFIDSWRYVPFLLAASFFSAISAFYGSLYSAAKKSVNVMISTVGTAVVNIVLNFILIPKYGVMGAGVATLVAYAFSVVFRALDSRKFIDFDTDHKKNIFLILLLLIQTISVTFEVYPIYCSIIVFVFTIVGNRKVILTMAKSFKKGR